LTKIAWNARSIRFSRKKTLSTPPDTSDPTQMPLKRLASTFRRTTMFSEATPTRQPSASRPVFSATASSPAEMTQFSTSTSLQASGSTPSVFGRSQDVLTRRFLTQTFSE